MNIFYLDQDPAKAAAYHCDKHVVKMVLETAQLLCGVYWLNGKPAPYKLTHQHHPCMKWAAESKANYEYLISLGLSLCSEYTKRYGKVHKSEQHIVWCKNNIGGLSFKLDYFTPPALAMPDKYKKPSAVISYRDYYIGEKTFAKWKLNKPFWYDK